SKVLHVFTATASDTAGNTSGKSGSAQLGSNQADTLTSGSGNDLMTGGKGADTFTFLASFANDIITDFNATGGNHDTINFNANPVLNSFANVLSHAFQVGTSVVISQDSSDTLTLNNVLKSNLTAHDFTFV